MPRFASITVTGFIAALIILVIFIQMNLDHQIIIN